MKKSTKRERLVWLGWLLVGIGAAALVGLFCMPWPMAKAAGLPDGAAVKGVAVVSVTVSDDPVIATALDSESCQKLADCLRGLHGRWSGFTGKTFTQYHRISYEIYVRYAEDGQLMHCRLFDGKLYCESFRYTLTDSDAARLTQCITELMETHAE